MANASSQFQRLMDLLLAGLIWEAYLVYLDDIIVFAPTFEQHLNHLKTLFDRIASSAMKLKASKCELFRSEVHFLGTSCQKMGYPHRLMRLKPSSRDHNPRT